MEKTWTATDVELGKLTIVRQGSALHIERRYVFVDAGQNELTQIAGGRVIEEIEIAEIPSDILAALQRIDQWTKNLALEQEGM